MMRLDATSLSVLVGAFAVLGPGRARAETLPCSPMVIEADASVTIRWPGLLDQVHEAFDARDDIDRCARVRLTSRSAVIAVEVVLPDGRSAVRSVSRREDVVPTFEALLLVPEHGDPAPTEALAASASSPPPAAPTDPPSEASPGPARDVSIGRAPASPARDAPAAPSPPAPSRVRVELSLATGARIGDGQTGVGLGALSFLEIAGWLVGFEARVDRYRMLSDAPPDVAPSGGALELALRAGRRIRYHDIAVDIDGGLAAAWQGTSTFESVSPATGTAMSGSSSSTVPRLLLGARMHFGARSMLHPFVGIDGEYGPPRANGADLPGAPRLPIATLGLALGGALETP
jgi:hypothetical protein